MRSAAAILYGAVMTGRNVLYDLGVLPSYDTSLPVVCVGNATAGGNGKTPFVQYVARVLLDNGRQPVILSRGYGGSKIGPYLVSPADTPDLVGDEPAEHVRRFHAEASVVVSRDRVAGAAMIESEKLGDIIVLDDGLQHRRLGRSVNLLLIDLTSAGDLDAWRRGRLLPHGFFRETKAQALKRASAVVAIKRGIRGRIEWSPSLRSDLALPERMPIVRAELTPDCLFDVFSRERVELDSLEGASGRALTAIAKPQPFFDTLRALGVTLEAVKAYPDHYAFTETDFLAMAGEKDVPLFVTQKDAVKLSFAAERGHVFSLQIGVTLTAPEDEAALWSLLEL